MKKDAFDKKPPEEQISSCVEEKLQIAAWVSSNSSTDIYFRLKNFFTNFLSVLRIWGKSNLVGSPKIPSTRTFQSSKKTDRWRSRKHWNAFSPWGWTSTNQGSMHARNFGKEFLTSQRTWSPSGDSLL
jgi:hypothetical protein